MLCRLVCGRLFLSAGRFELQDLAVLQIAEPQPARASDEEVQHGPAEAEATGLTREATDHLSPPADLLERALQQVGGTEALAQTREILEVYAERWQVLSQA